MLSGVTSLRCAHTRSNPRARIKHQKKTRGLTLDGTSSEENGSCPSTCEPHSCSTLPPPHKFHRTRHGDYVSTLPAALGETAAQKNRAPRTTRDAPHFPSHLRDVPFQRLGNLLLWHRSHNLFDDLPILKQQ